MTRSTLRRAITILTVITAVIHLALGITSDDFLGVLLVLNGIIYLLLLLAFLRPFAFLAGRETLVHYAFMAFTAVTILAYVFINGDFTSVVGMATKIDEILLIAALWQHLRSVETAAA